VETVRKINGTLRLALKRLPRDFGLPNPALDVELPRRERVTVQYPLRPDQMRRLWAAAAAVDDRLAALWRLAAHVPSRSGELRALKWTDWDEATGVLLPQRSLRGAADAGRALDEKAPKTAADRRVLELDPALAAELRAHRERPAAERRAAGRAWVDHGLLFCTRYGTPLAKGHLLRALRRLLRLAGLSEHHRVHDLRHTAVQNLLLSGASLPEASGAAGHASPAVTSALYAHAVRRVRAELLGRLGAFYGAAGPAGGGADPDAHGPAAPIPTVLPPDGQVRALSPAQIEEAQRLRAGGATQAQLAARSGVSPSTINRALRGVTGRRPGQGHGQDLSQGQPRGAAPGGGTTTWFTERAGAADATAREGGAGHNPAQVSPKRGIRTRMTAPHDGATILGGGG
jgi:integrase